MRVQSFDCIKGRVYGPVAGRRFGFLHVVNEHCQLSRLRPLGATNHPQAFHHQTVIGSVLVAAHQGDQIFFVDFLFAVSQLFKPHENVLELVISQCESKVFKL